MLGLFNDSLTDLMHALNITLCTTTDTPLTRRLVTHR